MEIAQIHWNRNDTRLHKSIRSNLFTRYIVSSISFQLLLRYFPLLAGSIYIIRRLDREPIFLIFRIRIITHSKSLLTAPEIDRFQDMFEYLHRQP